MSNKRKSAGIFLWSARPGRLAKACRKATEAFRKFKEAYNALPENTRRSLQQS